MRTEVAPQFLLVDLFCGFGGTSTGFKAAELKPSHVFKTVKEFGKVAGFDDATAKAQFNKPFKLAKIIGAINHDPKAIKSHWMNYPEVKHFEEDIRSLDLTGLVELVKYWRSIYPNAKVILWASLECINFSKAKGGQSRDADSRTLAQSLFQKWIQSPTNPKSGHYVDGDSYIQLLNPDYIMIENVVEFMAWGPMRIKAIKRHKDFTELKTGINKDTGQTEYLWEPFSKKNGADFLQWKNTICNQFGYYDDWKQMNSADFGAFTSRNRLFGCFAKHGLPIIWPEATHAKIKEIKTVKKKPAKPNMQAAMDFDVKAKKPWRACKEVLDFTDQGNTIFQDLIPKKRQAALKYLQPGKKKKQSENKTIIVFPASYENPLYGMEPKLILNTKNISKAPKLLEKYCKAYNLTEDQLSFYRYDPYSVATLERIYAGLIKFVAKGDTSFLAKYFSGRPEGKVIPTDGPAGAITTAAGQYLVNTSFIVQRNGGDPAQRVVDLNGPARTLTGTGGNQDLVNPAFLMPTHFANAPQSLEDPAGAITADRHYTYLVNPAFICNHKSGDPKSKNTSIEQPMGALTTIPSQTLVQPICLVKYNSKNKKGKYVPPSFEQPAPSLNTQGRLGLLQTETAFGQTYYGNGGIFSVDDPCPTLGTKDTAGIITPLCIMNPSHGGCNTSTDAPCPVIVARQDKAPLSVLQV